MVRVEPAPLVPEHQQAAARRVRVREEEALAIPLAAVDVGARRDGRRQQRRGEAPMVAGHGTRAPLAAAVDARAGRATAPCAFALTTQTCHEGASAPGASR